MSNHPTIAPIRALFIAKKRSVYGYPNGQYSTEMTSGLYNSASFVSNMLRHHGISSKTVEVVDNNDIERELVKYKATHVIIEALWVVPEKLKLLATLYPYVTWVIRIHSNTPFIANEGNAFDWIKGYIEIAAKNIVIAPNTVEFLADILTVTGEMDSLKLLPNYYQFTYTPRLDTLDRSRLHIGCFGAIRPLKNQLIQAIAAMAFADMYAKQLTFHINGGRIEQDGNSVLKNIRAIFKGSSHELVEHAWLPRTDFLALTASMDVNLQVSFSETFNIVTADSVNAGVPVVVSKEIKWVNPAYFADTTDTDDIVDKLTEAYRGNRRGIAVDNWMRLQQYNADSARRWLRFLFQ